MCNGIVPVPRGLETEGPRIAIRLSPGLGEGGLPIVVGLVPGGGAGSYIGSLQEGRGKGLALPTYRFI